MLTLRHDVGSARHEVRAVMLRRVTGISQSSADYSWSVGMECGHKVRIERLQLIDAAVPWPPLDSKLCPPCQPGIVGKIIGTAPTGETISTGPVDPMDPWCYEDLGWYGCSDCELPRGVLVRPDQRHSMPDAYTWLTCPYCGTPFDSREHYVESINRKLTIEICHACALGMPMGRLPDVLFDPNDRGKFKLKPGDV